MHTFGTAAVQLHLISFSCSVVCGEVYWWKDLCRSLINFHVCCCTGVHFEQSLPPPFLFSLYLVFHTGKSEVVYVLTQKSKCSSYALRLPFLGTNCVMLDGFLSSMNSLIFC